MNSINDNTFYHHFLFTIFPFVPFTRIYGDMSSYIHSNIDGLNEYHWSDLTSIIKYI